MEQKNKIFAVSKDKYSDTWRQINMVLAAISNGMPVNTADIINIGTWKTVQSIVKLGLADKFFKVGDQLQSTHEIYGEGTSKTLTWDIIGIDYDIPVDDQGNEIIVKDLDGTDINAHSMTLQLHNCLNTHYPFNLSTHENGASGVNWKESDIRRWLNTDQVINGYSANSGFLDGFDEDLLSIIGNCQKATRRQGDGNLPMITNDRIFIPSETEMFGGYNGGYNEGAVLKSRDTIVNQNKIYYTKDNNDLLTKITLASDDSRNPSSLNWYEVKTYYSYYGAYNEEYNPYGRSDLQVAGSGADSNRIKKVINSNSIWLLRTYSYNFNTETYMRMTQQDGGINVVNYQTNTVSSKGVSPCFIIS